MSRLPLDKMTVEEKLDELEAIWEDLARNAEDVPSPAWHGALLAERRKAIEEGRETFEDWETAKHKLREELE